MGRLKGGKDYSSVRVNYSKSGSTLSVLTWGFQVCEVRDGNSWCCETEDTEKSFC